MNLSSFLLGSMTLMIQQFADKYQQEDLQKTLSELDSDLNFPRIATYDFIIVGGGTAGCLVAGRLSEKFNVLLLESGGSPVPATANPFLNLHIYEHTAINNIFQSVPQLNFSQEDPNAGIIRAHTGRMLGGSGSHNGNIYSRGSPSDYDNFARLTGDDSWAYKNILRHFKSFENFIGELVNEGERDEFYSTGGPLTVNTEMAPILPAWFKAAEELGFKTGDPNGNQSEGFAPMTKSMKNGERDSTYTAFVKPFESNRHNLTVLRYSEVEQILINKDKVAYGVAYKRHGMPQIAHASKEVIISSGTFSSPMLLMKSGIGPKEILEQAEIPVLSDLAGVGQNFRDHGAVLLLFKANSPNSTLLPTVEEEDLEIEISKYHEKERKGFMTRMDVGPQAYIVSSRAKEDGEPNWPDLQIAFAQLSLFNKDDPQQLMLMIILNRLKSFGEIRFNSTAYRDGDRDDTKLALPDYRLFSEPSDAQVLIEGIELGLRIMENTTPFQNMDVVYDGDTPESCADLEFRSHEYWECYIQQRAVTWNHVVGTCSMGQESDTMTVVDSKLRVRGIKNLRVVDASIMPRITNANLNAGVILVAEKASQDILSEYQNPPEETTTPNSANFATFRAEIIFSGFIIYAYLILTLTCVF